MLPYPARSWGFKFLDNVVTKMKPAKYLNTTDIFVVLLFALKMGKRAMVNSGQIILDEAIKIFESARVAIIQGL